MTFQSTRRRLCTGIATAAALATATLPAAAQSDAPYPSRPIELIVAYAPGGGTDLVARLVARHLEKALGGTPIRLLGQAAATRSSLAPQVPTFKEQGIDIELASLRGAAAPKGLPEAVRKKLVDAIAAIAANAEFQQQAMAMYAPLRYLPPAAHAAELERAEVGFRKLWAELPWQDKP